MSLNQTRDTMVVGASAGGIAALGDLLSRLPSDLAGAVAIVQHQDPHAGQLAQVLRASSKLPVQVVKVATKMRNGHVYVGPPDLHLVVDGDTLRTVRSARENRSRPAINVLFRTAAATRGSRVIGVILTGLLDDGTAGMEAIKRCGGVTVAQDPEEAAFPDMPLSAIEHGAVDHVCKILQVPDLLVSLLSQPAPLAEIPESLALEARLSGLGAADASGLERIGEQVALACPECGGPLWQVADSAELRFRCHTGHALTAYALLESQADEIEHALWAGVRALSERASTLDRMATQAAGQQHSRLKERFERDAREARSDADRARHLLHTLERVSVPPVGEDPIKAEDES